MSHVNNGSRPASPPITEEDAGGSLTRIQNTHIVRSTQSFEPLKSHVVTVLPVGLPQSRANKDAVTAGLNGIISNTRPVDGDMALKLLDLRNTYVTRGPGY